MGSGGSESLAWAVPDERGGTARPPRVSRVEWTLSGPSQGGVGPSLWAAGWADREQDRAQPSLCGSPIPTKLAAIPSGTARASQRLFVCKVFRVVLEGVGRALHHLGQGRG